MSGSNRVHNIIRTRKRPTVSEQVLESLATTFQLEREERRHLFVLARGMIPAHRDDEKREI